MLNKIIYLITFGIASLIFGIVLFSSYTAPSIDSINITLCNSYTAPAIDQINITLGTDNDCGAVTSCAVYITPSNQWYVPANCTCYKEGLFSKEYINFNDWGCTSK